MEEYAEIRRKVMEEYRRIAFSPAGPDLKIADKLRALDAYVTLCGEIDQEAESDSEFTVRVEYV